MRRMLVAMLLVAAACGNSEPPAPKPVSKTRTEAPPPPAPVDRDLEQSELAIAALEAAKTPQEAHDARGLYTGTERAGTVDRIFKKRLSDLDFAEMSAAIAAIRACETPEDAVKAAELYTGEVHNAAVERTMNEHIDNLIKEDPTLRRPNTGRPKEPTATSSKNNELDKLFERCRNESDAAEVIDTYKGDASEKEMLAALERWRWRSPVVLQSYSGEFGYVWNLPTVLLNDGRLFVQESNGRRIFCFDAQGSLVREIRHERAGGLLGGVSPDGRYVFTVSRAEKPYMKWDTETGELLLEFGIPQGSDFGGNPRGWLSPDGSVFVSMMVTAETHAWDAESGEMLQDLGKIGMVHEARFSADGKEFWVCSQQRVQGHSLETGALLNSIRRTTDAPARYSPDCTRLAAWTFEVSEEAGQPAQSRYYLLILNPRDGSTLKTIPVPHRPLSIHWLASGRHILATLYSSLILVDIEDGSIVHSHTLPQQLGSSTLSEDGRSILIPEQARRENDGKLLLPKLARHGREP